MSQSAGGRSTWLVTLGVTVALGVSLLLAACDGRVGQQQPEPAEQVTIAATTLPASAPIYVAAEQDFFAEQGLDVRVMTFDAGKQALQAVTEGRADFAALAETPIAGGALEDEPFVVVATIAEVEGAAYIVGRADAGIANTQDLRDARIGVVTTSAAEVFLHMHLITSGINPADVDIIALPPDDIVNALVRGDVDAISSWPPHTFEAERRLGAGAEVITDVPIYTMSWNVAVTREYADEEQDTIRRVLRALIAATRFIEANPEAAMEVAGREAGMPGDRFEEYWEQHVWGVRLDQNLLLELEYEAAWLSQNGERPEFLDYVDTRALRAVSPGAVSIIEPGN